MERIIKSMEDKYLQPSLELVEAVFTVSESEEDGKLVRNLVKEIRSKAVIVEGNPMNYRNRGFVTSAPFGITAHESVGLPAPECMMVKELVPGSLKGMHGQVSYHDYQTLR